MAHLLSSTPFKVLTTQDILSLTPKIAPLSLDQIKNIQSSFCVNDIQWGRVRWVNGVLQQERWSSNNPTGLEWVDVSTE